MAQEHWTEVEARAVLAAQRKSGLSIEAFARGHGVHPQRLYWWRKKLTATVMPVRIVEREPPRGEPVTILLRSGHILKVGRDFDEVAFVRAVELLGGIG